jgi:hypothetical protein
LTSWRDRRVGAKKLDAYGEEILRLLADSLIRHSPPIHPASAPRRRSCHAADFRPVWLAWTTPPTTR